MRKVVLSKRQTFGQALIEQRNIMGAVILRDLRTRFFNHGLGFLIVPLFPFVHLFALVLLFSLLRNSFGYGEDMRIFFATGLIPTLTFMYVSRYMSLSLVMNRPMLAYPIIGVMEIVLGRAVLEIISAIWMAAAVFAVLFAIGSDPMPVDPIQAFFAFAMSVFLGAAAGLVVSLITMAAASFATIWALLLIVFYLTSGSLFVPSLLPEPVIMVLEWNPVLHCVEWMRTAYYPGYPDQVLDKSYVISVTTGLLVLGLFGERIMRRRRLMG